MKNPKLEVYIVGRPDLRGCEPWEAEAFLMEFVLEPLYEREREKIRKRYEEQRKAQDSEQ